MSTGDKLFARELARLTAEFVAQLPQKVSVLNDELVTSLSAPHDAALFDSLSHGLHQLKGAGSTFGCSGISNTAQELEGHLLRLRNDSVRHAKGEVDAAREAMARLVLEADRIHNKSVPGKRPVESS